MTNEELEKYANELNEKIELEISRRIANMEHIYPRMDVTEKELAEHKTLLAQYRQMFGDINSALRLAGDRFENHMEQINITNAKIDRVCDALVKFMKGVELLSKK